MILRQKKRVFVAGLHLIRAGRHIFRIEAQRTAIDRIPLVEAFLFIVKNQEKFRAVERGRDAHPALDFVVFKEVFKIAFYQNAGRQKAEILRRTDKTVQPAEERLVVQLRRHVIRAKLQAIRRNARRFKAHHFFFRRRGVWVFVVGIGAFYRDGFALFVNGHGRCFFVVVKLALKKIIVDIDLARVRRDLFADVRLDGGFFLKRTDENRYFFFRRCGFFFLRLRCLRARYGGRCEGQFLALLQALYLIARQHRYRQIFGIQVADVQLRLTVFDDDLGVLIDARRGRLLDDVGGVVGHRVIDGSLLDDGHDFRGIDHRQSRAVQQRSQRGVGVHDDFRFVFKTHDFVVVVNIVFQKSGSAIIHTAHIGQKGKPSRIDGGGHAFICSRRIGNLYEFGAFIFEVVVENVKIADGQNGV